MPSAFPVAHRQKVPRTVFMGTHAPAQKKRQQQQQQQPTPTPKAVTPLPPPATNKRKKRKMTATESASATSVAAFAAVEEPQILTLTALDPKSLCAVASASSGGLFAHAVRSDELWAHCLERTFGLVGEAAKRGPKGECTKSRYKSFQEWFGPIKDIGLSTSLLEKPLQQPLCSHFVPSWATIHRTLRKEASLIPQTLRPPATAEALEKLQAFFEECSPNRGRLHSAVKGFWSLHDGQNVPGNFCRNMLKLPPVCEKHEEMTRFQGLFGGYQVYDFSGSQWFLPLVPAVELTRILRDSFSEDHPTKLVFSIGLYGRGIKFMMVDMLDGSVFAGCNTKLPSQFLPAAPDQSTSEAREAGIVRWFAEYARRLEDGTYVERALVPSEPDETQGISLFPTKGPDYSVAVTRGVEVSASSLFAPELPAQGWAYSIALRLVGTKEERGFETCQLTTRTWNIEFEGERPDTIHGDGVIGLFPILRDGGWICDQDSDPHGQYNEENTTIEGEFRYQSCSQAAASMKGHFGGTVKMVPGRSRKPSGQPFDATVAPFRLAIPEYLF